jgi:mercuric ion transport protein
VLGRCQPPVSIALCSWQQRIAVARLAQKRDPGLKPLGIWRTSDEIHGMCPENMNKGGAHGVREDGFWKRQIDKMGVGGSLFGSFFAGLCCLGPPALMSILSAFGLTFLINNAILQPILVVFLLLSVFGLVLGWRHHGSPWALIIGVLGAVMAYVFRYVFSNSLLAWFGIACLVLASLLNVFLRRHRRLVAHS